MTCKLISHPFTFALFPPHISLIPPNLLYTTRLQYRRNTNTLLFCIKEKTPPMSHHSSAESDDQIPPQPLEFKRPHQPKDNIIIIEQEQEDESDKDDTQTQTQTPSSASKPHLSNNVEIALQEQILPPSVDITEESVELEPEAMAEDSGRERLKRHRVEVAGKVWIPDTWEQEEMLKDWTDCTIFDAPLVPSRIRTARTALVEEGRRESDGALRIEKKDVEFTLM